MANMTTRFNADEVFALAIRAEQNGAKYYRKAAALKAGEGGEFLEKLAVMEDGHERTFIKMRKELSEKEKQPTVFDPDDESVLYLAAMADHHGGEGSPALADSLTGKETMEEILKIALDLEQKSILFYLGLKDVVPEQLGRDRIDEIIKEEKEHVATLTRTLTGLKRS